MSIWKYGIIWDIVGPQKCHIFILFSFHHSSHFIVPLTFHYIIFINILGFHLIIFHFIHFSIKREFMIKYQKIDMFLVYISKMCELCNVQEYVKDYFKSLLKYLLHHFKEIIIQAYSKEKDHGDLDGISYPGFVRDMWKI